MRGAASPSHRGGICPRLPVYVEVEGDTLDFQRYYQIVKKYKWLILALVVTAVTVAVLETSSTTPLYRSTTSIQIDLPSNILPYEEIQPAQVPIQWDLTPIQVLQSRSLARRVVNRLNLAEDPRFNAKISSGFFLHRIPALLGSLTGWISSLLPAGPTASPARPQDRDSHLVSRFLGNLKVETSEEHRLVRVSYSSQDPEFAAAVVNTLTEEYIEYNFESKYEATTRATDFLQRQLRGLKISIEKSEEDLIHYAKANGLLNVGKQEDIVTQTLAYLNQELSRVEAELIAQRAAYRIIEDTTPENFPQHLNSETIVRLEGVRFDLEKRLAGLSSQFGPGWPSVIQLQQELSAVEKQVHKEKLQAIKRAREEYEVASEHFKMLLVALEEKKALATSLTEASIQYNILEREVDTNKQLYEGLLQRLKEAGVSAGLKSSNVHVVDPGEVPTGSYYPQRSRNLTIGLIMGLFCGFGLAFLLDHLDKTVKTPEDIEQDLTLPSLGIIPTFSTMTSPGERRLLSGNGNGLSVLSSQDSSQSKMWEAYRSLRASLLLSQSEQEPQTILITSALPREGKSTTAVNTAIVLARTGAPTLLVDLDLRKPSLAATLGINGKSGMSTFLTGHSDLWPQIRQTFTPNLFFLPAGPLPPNPTELLGCERMQKALTVMQGFFKYIVIDSPPLFAVTDALILSKHVDGVVLVVHGAHTSKDAVKKASHQLSRVGGKLLGAMVNNVDIRHPEYSYYYNYYSQDYYPTLDPDSQEPDPPIQHPVEPGKQV